jgi:hypothetical protein
MLSGDAEHLTPTVSERGFTRLPPIVGAYGGTVRVYESSAAIGPHIWLAVNEDASSRVDQMAAEAHSHLTVEAAGQLADQLRWLIDHHYQTRGNDG